MPTKNNVTNMISFDRLNLRNCRDSDYGFVHNLTRNNMKRWIDKYWGGWDSDKFRADFKKKNIKIVEYVRKRIGFYDIEPKEDFLYIHNVQLIKSFQGKGIGKYIIAQIEGTLFTSGKNKIVLEVFRDNPAKKLYLKLGFCILKKNANSITMVKNFQ